MTKPAPQDTALEELLRSQQRYHMVQATAGFGIWEYDIDAQMITHWSDKVYEIAGLENMQVAPSVDAYLATLHPDDSAALQEALALCIAHQTPYELLLRHYHANGTKRWAITRGMPVVEEGRVVRLIGSLLDVTEATENAQALARTNHLLTKTHDAVRMGTWEIDVASDRVYWSPITREIHEVDANFTPQTSTGIAFYPEGEDQTAIRRHYEALVASGEPYDLRLQIITARGNRRWVRTIGLAEHHNGVCLRTYGLFQDISAEVEAQQLLALTNERLEESSRLAGIGHWEANLATGALWWSEVIYDIFQLDPATKPSVALFNSFLHPDDEPLVRASEERAAETGRHDVEHRIILADGSVRWVHELAFLRPDEQGNPVRLVGTVQDITYRKEIERMKNEFISTVSHELRTPITAISGGLKLVNSGALGEMPSPEAQELLAIAEQNSERLLALISDLLDIGHLSTGRLTLNPTPCTVADLLARALRNNRSYADAYRVRLRLELSVAEHCTVLVDSARFLQIMDNLLSNAIKFSPVGCDVLVNATESDITANGRSVHISVTDQGPGVPVEFIPHLFERFAQADASDQRKKGGTGLGLAIARELAEAMGGCLIYQQNHRGAQFVLSLPC